MNTKVLSGHRNTCTSDTLQYGEIYNFPQAVFEKALDDEEMDEDTEAGDEESASEPEDEEQVRKLLL